MILMPDWQGIGPSYCWANVIFFCTLLRIFMIFICGLGLRRSFVTGRVIFFSVLEMKLNLYYIYIFGYIYLEV